MNNSCEPNCETQKWHVNGDLRIGLFATKDISAGSKLTFNYNMNCFGGEKVRCPCSSNICSRYLGVRPKTPAAADAERRTIAQIRRQQKKQKQSKNIRLSNTPRSQAVAKNDTVAPNIASGDAKLASVRESSNGICHTESASKVNSASFSMDSLTAVKCVPLMHGQKVHVTSSGMRGVQPSVKRKHGHHGRPLSVRGGQHLIVKGFAFYQKCKRSRTAAPSGVADEKDGDSAEAFVSSETDMSSNKVVQESPAIRAPDGIHTRVVRRRNLPQETLAGAKCCTVCLQLSEDVDDIQRLQSVQNAAARLIKKN